MARDRSHELVVTADEIGALKESCTSSFFHLNHLAAEVSQILKFVELGVAVVKVFDSNTKEAEAGDSL